MDTAYVEGFMAKCAEHGIDPEALVKQAQLTSDYKRQRSGRIGGTLGALLGLRTGLRMADLPLSTIGEGGRAVGKGAIGALLAGLLGRSLGRMTVPKTQLERTSERVGDKAQDLSGILKKRVGSLKG